MKIKPLEEQIEDWNDEEIIYGEPQIFTRWIDPTINEYKQQIDQLTNNWNELKDFIIEQEEINNGAMKCGLSSGSEIKEMDIQNDIYDLILDKMKEIRGE